MLSALLLVASCALTAGAFSRFWQQGVNPLSWALLGVALLLEAKVLQMQIRSAKG